MTFAATQDALATRIEAFLANEPGGPDIAERAAHELMASPHVATVEATTLVPDRLTRLIAHDPDGDPVLHITVFHAQRAAAIVVPEHAMELHTLETGR